MNKQNQSCGFGKCDTGYCPKPKNRELYKKIRTNVIRSSSKWPSRYASYELVNNYKNAGGEYNCERCGVSFGSCSCNKQVNSFGNSYVSFYPKGFTKNTYQTPFIKNCLNNVYGPEDASYNKGYQPDITTGLNNPGSFGFGKSAEIRYLKKFNV